MGVAGASALGAGSCGRFCKAVNMYTCSVDMSHHFTFEMAQDAFDKTWQIFDKGSLNTAAAGCHAWSSVASSPADCV